MLYRTISKESNVAIYVFWSPKKTLDANTIRYLQELRNVAEVVLFVSNSLLDPKEIPKIKELGISFLQRENVGFDFWGWKEGIEKLEDQIKTAENLILCNSSCFLAFHSLASLLARMDDKADIWGVSSFKDRNITFHLQSYFLVFKKNILKDWESFMSFWVNLPKMEKWQEAVTLGELRLTKFYLDKGFKCEAIAQPTIFPSQDVNPSFYYPVQLFQAGSPFLKKKIFSEDYRLFLFASNGETPRMAMNFVREKEGYYNDILSELITTSTPSHLIQILQLNYIVDARQYVKRTGSHSKAALICYVFYEDMVEYISNIMFRFNQISDIYVVSSKKELINLYRERLKFTLPSANYRLQKNRGRNEAAYFISCKDVWQKYDYVCALHDKKTAHVKPALQGIDFMKHCEQNLCPSPNAIIEVIELFENNPLLGLLVPPLPFFGNFISSSFNPTGQNKNSLKLLDKKLFSGKLFPSNQIDVFSAPLGGMFWARTKALVQLSSSSLSVQDFPEEPINTFDGTILHALERCYPMVAKSAGFYTARIFNLYQIPLIYNNLIYFCIKIPPKERFFFSSINKLKQGLSRFPFLYSLARTIFKKITRN